MKVEVAKALYQGTEKQINEVCDLYCQRNLAEMYLIYSYVMDGYRHINLVLREDGKTAACLKPYFAVLRKAFSAFKPYLGEVWRGVDLPVAQASKLAPGQVMSWKAYSSTSLNRGVAESFASYSGGDRERVLFKLKSKTCRHLGPITDAGYWRGEKEVLCLPGTRVKVIKVDTSSGNKVVELEEVVAKK